MKINVNGKLNPYISLSIFLSYILLIALMSFSQDKEAVLQQLELIENGVFSKTTLLLTQGVTALVLFIIIPIIFLKVSGVEIRATFFKNKKYDVQSFLMVLVLVIGFMPMNTYIGDWNSQIPFPSKIVEMEETLARVTEAITSFSSLGEFIIGFIVIAIFAGFGEELTFRAILQSQFNTIQKNKHVAIWLSAFLFSAIHMQFLGFFPRMLLGALFGYIYVWSGNVTLAMFGHFVNNGFAVIMMHLHNTNVIEADLDKIESIPFSLALGSLAFTVGIIFFLRKKLLYQIN